MNRWSRRIAVSFSALLILLAVRSLGRAEVDQGSVRVVPWSGTYWPIRDGQLIRGPLRKYDRLTGHRAAQWEMQQNPPSTDVPEWYGYCHAWSAASILDREPSQVRQARALDSLPLQLSIGDQKGMLTACHTDDVAQHYGVRYHGQPGDDPNDIYPDELWRALKLYIQQRGVPLIVDIEGGAQVWNYPVYAYRVDYRQESGNRYFAEMSLWMADDAVPPDIVGTQVSKQTYYFTFQMQGGAAALGSARWVEPSVGNHPDFAWYPYVVRAENPEVRYGEVKRLVSSSTGVSPPQTLPPGTTVSSSLPPNLLPGASGAIGLPENFVPADPSAEPAEVGRPAERQPGTATLPGASQPYFLSPMELLSVVVNRTSYFPLDVTVDKFDGGHYLEGQSFLVSGGVGANGYLYLLYLDSQGQLSMLFPRPGESNVVAKDRRFLFPRLNATAPFRTTGPPGTHRIKAIVSARPLVFGSVSRWQAENLPAGVKPQHLVLPPTQKAKFKKVLSQYASGRAPGAEELGRISPRQFLGEFGQDEVAIYVGPANPAAPTR